MKTSPDPRMRAANGSSSAVAACSTRNRSRNPRSVPCSLGLVSLISLMPTSAVSNRMEKGSGSPARSFRALSTTNSAFFAGTVVMDQVLTRSGKRSWSSP